MSELIKRQDAINAVAQLYKYESDRMTALQEVSVVTEQEIRNKAIDEFAHELKETLNRDIPFNYESTRPYFTLENARMIVDEVVDQLKRGL